METADYGKEPAQENVCAVQHSSSRYIKSVFQNNNWKLQILRKNINLYNSIVIKYNIIELILKQQ